MSEHEEIKQYLNDRWRAAKTDLAMIERLLSNFDDAGTSVQDGYAPTFTQGQGRHGKSVRLMTEEILEREGRWMRSREIYNEIVEEVGPHAGTKRLVNNIRTVLYNLNREGKTENDGGGLHRWIAAADAVELCD